MSYLAQFQYNQIYRANMMPATFATQSWTPHEHMSKSHATHSQEYRRSAVAVESET